jgi:hypothetical protein
VVPGGDLFVSERGRSRRNTDQVVEPRLQWHPSLYAGSAPYYAIGRVSYPTALAEALAEQLGQYRVISFAQSFHWMDQLPVARAALTMFEDAGACVHVHATTHQGVDSDAVLPHPRPPRSAIDELVERYLGPRSRIGGGVLPADKAGRERQIVERTSDQIVAGVFSLSSATPHLFGERHEAFEADLRRLLGDANPSGIFSEQMREIAADIWRASGVEPAVALDRPRSAPRKALERP